MEKRLVTAWLKRMIFGCVTAAMMATSFAYAAQDGDRDDRELRANRKDKLLQSRQLHKQRAHPVQSRLSPEERRQLRRDIKNAGREIYPPQP